MKHEHTWIKAILGHVGKTGQRREPSRSRVRSMSFEGLERRDVMTGLGGITAPPTLAINDGLELTNVRTVEVSFDNVDANVQSMRFAFNGFNYGNWKTFTPTTKVTIPSYQGTNYVNAELLFADGSKRMVYDSIVYRNPLLLVNDAASQTNTRQVTLSFGDIAPDAVSVELAYNGFNYHEPIAFTPTMTVTLPSYEGNNYVNARIIYPDQATRFVWDSIAYRPARLQINDGDPWTGSREVTLSFLNVTSDAEQVSFAFNGTNYQQPVDFESTMTVTVPNWEGTNYVNARIQYADGRELWIWDSIEYVPTVVKSCSECVTFELLVQDDRGEGFHDVGLGDDRVKAFTYALGIWSNLLHASYAGETITVEATIDSIPKTDDGKTVLGGARPNHFSMVDELVHGDALANHKEGLDLDSTAEIWAQLNSDVTWYYGTDGQTNGHDDFVSTVLHEIGHGLNFYDTISHEGSWNASLNGQPVPGVYGSFLVDENGTMLTSMSNAQRAAAITSGMLFWNGAHAMAANAGQQPQIYAPTTYESGSSVDHLDESTHQTELMSPRQTGADHSPSELELGMLNDMGWTLM